LSAGGHGSIILGKAIFDAHFAVQMNNTH